MSFGTTPADDKQPDVRKGAIPANDFESTPSLDSEASQQSGLRDAILEERFADFEEAMHTHVRHGELPSAKAVAERLIDYYSGCFETHVRVLLLNAELHGIDPRDASVAMQYYDRVADLVTAVEYLPTEAVADFAQQYLPALRRSGRIEKAEQFFEPLLAQFSESELNRDGRVRMIRIELGSFYLAQQKLDAAEGHLLHSVNSTTVADEEPDLISQIGCLRLAQLYKLTGQLESASVLFRQSADFLIRNIENAEDAVSVSRLAVEASLGLVSVEMQEALVQEPPAVEALFSRLERIEKIASEYLNEDAIEFSNIDLMRVEIKKHLGYRDSLQNELFTILRYETEAGRAQGAGASAARMHLAMTAASGAREAYQAFKIMLAEGGREELFDLETDPAVLTDLKGLQVTGEVLVKILREHLDMESTFRRFLPSQPEEGFIELQAVFSAFQSVVKSQVDRAVKFYEDFLTCNASPANIEVVYQHIQNLYESLGMEEKAEQAVLKKQRLLEEQ